MLFSMLGPLVVSGDDEIEVPLRQRKQRHLLVTLALHSPESLPTERIADLVWGNESSASPGTVRTQMWALRREPRFASLIAHDQRGYKLDMRCSEIDADRFTRLSQDGMRLLARAEAEHAAIMLGQALALWREPLLCDIPETPGMAPVRDRLLTERAAAQDTQITARLTLQQHHQVLGILTERVAREPEREQSWAQLMLALYRCGRRAEALETYARSWKELSDEFGIEPGPQLRRIHELILRDDPALWSARAGQPELFLGPRALGLRGAHADRDRAGPGADRRLAAGGVAGGKRTAADLGAWLIFEDESGQGLRPPKGRTWDGVAKPRW